MHRHHILPKYRGGSNDPTNIIRVSIRQHAMWHFCNWRLWEDERDYCAWKGLTGALTKRQIFGRLATAKKKGLIPTESEEGCVSLRILDILETNNYGMTPKDINQSIGQSERHIRRCLVHLFNENQITRSTVEPARPGRPTYLYWLAKTAILEVDCDETMKCVKCDSLSNLMGSESIGHTVRRLRICSKCGHKFLTYEIPQRGLDQAEEFVESGKVR